MTPSLRRTVLDLAYRAAASPLLPAALTVAIVLAFSASLAFAVSRVPTATPIPAPRAAAAAPGTLDPSPAPSTDANAGQAGTGGTRLPGLGPAAPGAPAPSGPRSWLSVPSVGLGLSVVDYTDCTGATPMTRSAAIHFLCTPNAVTALVGHNPGVFTPLLGTHPGDTVTYQPPGGAPQSFQIRAPSRVSPLDAALATQDASFPHLVLSTCAVPDSSAYWVFIATPVSSGSPGGTPGGSPGGSGGSSGGGNAGGGNGGGGPVPPAPSPTPTGLLGGLLGR